MSESIVPAHAAYLPEVTEVIDRITLPPIEDGTNPVEIIHSYHLMGGRWEFPWYRSGVAVGVVRVEAIEPMGGGRQVLWPQYVHVERLPGVQVGLDRGSLVIDGLDLTPFNNRIPNIEVVMSPEGVNNPGVETRSFCRVPTTRAYMPTTRQLIL